MDDWREEIFKLNSLGEQVEVLMDMIDKMRANMHPNPKLYMGSLGLYKFGYHVRTGEFRPPKSGEYFLSGAIPQVYRCANDLASDYHIMRPASKKDQHCWWCGQFRQDKVEK